MSELVTAIQIGIVDGEPVRYRKQVRVEHAVKYQGQWWLVEDAANEVFGGKAVTQMYADCLAEITGSDPDTPPLTLLARAQAHPHFNSKLAQFREHLKGLIQTHKQ